MNLDLDLAKARLFALQIREATVADARQMSEFITPIVQKFILPSCRPEGEALLLNSLSVSAIAEYLSQDYRFHLASNDQQLLGVVGIKARNHLYHLFIMPQMQRTGLGQQLWLYARQSAMAAGADGHFTVNSALAAVGFYQKLGFTAMTEPRDRGGVVDVPMSGYFPAC